MLKLDRRNLLTLAAAAVPASLLNRLVGAAGANRDIRSRMAFGLVTYQWGNEWDLPTVIKNCEAAQVFGVELRTTHAHGVEPTLDQKQRQEVQQRFGASRVELVGLGSDERFDNPDPTVLKSAVAKVKEFLRLSHDVGGTGVKVKPNRFHPGVPKEQTIEQIGKALNDVADYGAGYGQQVRLEVHGQCAELTTIKAIMDFADNENAVVCWNSNPQDLAGDGLESNFNLVRHRFGRTCHVHPLDSPEYPYQQLLQLLIASEYDGWVMIESGDRPADRQAALARQAALFTQMVAQAEKNLSA
jgi:sugar phosphate isomerase/epimerase